MSVFQGCGDPRLGEGGKPGQEEGQLGTLFFSSISEVTEGGGAGGLSKVVKSICSREGGKEKRLVREGRRTKGKLYVGSAALPAVV